MNENIFAIRMRETRIKKGISQAELSRITGIAPATLSSYESEDKPKSPPIDKALTIANALGVSLDWLCSSETNKKDSTSETEFPFKRIIDAIMLILSLESTSISRMNVNKGNDFASAYIPAILIDSTICERFLNEYNKIKAFIDSPDYDQYLKDSLKKAVSEKFNDFIVHSGIIESEDGKITVTEIPVFEDAPF